MANTIDKKVKKLTQETQKKEKNSIRENFQKALENWQEAILEKNNKIDKIKKLTQKRDELLYELVNKYSKYYVSKHRINETNITFEDLSSPAYTKILCEFNEKTGKPNEVTIEFLTNNYKKYKNSHKETVSFIIGRIKNSFLVTIRQNNYFQKGNKKTPIIPIIKDYDDDNYKNDIEDKEVKIEFLLENNIEYSFGYLPKLLIILNRVLLNQLWCIKKTGPTQVTSYLLNYLIHNNDNSIYKDYNIDKRVIELISKETRNINRTNNDCINLNKKEILKSFSDWDIIINKLRNEEITISTEKVPPFNNNNNKLINIINKNDFNKYLQKNNIELDSIINKIKNLTSNINSDPKLVERIVKKRADNHIKVLKEEKYDYFKYFLSKNFEQLINKELNSSIQIYCLFHEAFFQTAFTDNEETQFRQLFINKVLDNNKNGEENYEQKM